jgi:hypothetical protein
MRCEQCGTEFSDDCRVCPECSHSLSEVEILTPEEREDFQGITIENPGHEAERQDDYTYEYHGPHKGVYVRGFNFNFGKGGLLNRILVGLIVAGVLFLAAPIIFGLLGVVVIGGILSLVLRRR